METITVSIAQSEVYDEVAKATDYTGSKMIGSDEGARDRILAGDQDLSELSRFWEEAIMAVNENLKEMFISGMTTQKIKPGEVKPGEGDIVATPVETTPTYAMVLEVSTSFDKTLTASVESMLRSFFIATIIGYWFKFANKEESSGYFAQAAEFMAAAERLLYSRRKPSVPKS